MTSMVRTGELDTKLFGYPVGLILSRTGHPVATGCETISFFDKVIGGIGTLRVEYSAGLETFLGLVHLVDADI
jgi:hypothetical protein